MHSNNGSAMASVLDAGGLGACTELGAGAELGMEVPPEVGIGINLAMWDQWCFGVGLIGLAVEPGRVQQRSVWPAPRLSPENAREQGAHREKLPVQRCGN